MVETFPNGPLEVRKICKFLHCSYLYVWYGVVGALREGSHKQVPVWEVESSRGAVEEMKLLLERGMMFKRCVRIWDGVGHFVA